MQDKESIMKETEEYAFHVYNRFPVVFKKGEGVHLYDTDGKEYLDFGSGIGVNAFGYGDPEYTEALKDQIDKLMHISNLYYHPNLLDASKKAVLVSGMDKVFFTNSGAEAIEGAIKTAKKYAFLKGNKDGSEIIAMEHSFHGRTVGAVSVTGTSHYREPFYPLMDGVKFAKFNDIDSVKEVLSEKTCAILLEPVQGEGGIYPADKEFLAEIRKICNEKDILLIFDEIQCGMGRTGKYFTYQKYDIKPDILCSAKALGGGIPVGAFFVTERVAKSSLEPGDHGTTYGGNPLALAAVSRTITLMEKRKLPEHVEALTPYLEAALDRVKDKFDFVKGRRGMGFMQGLILDIPVGDVVKAALEEGLVVLSAGSDVLRLLPPLVIEEKDIDEFEEKIIKTLGRF